MVSIKCSAPTKIILSGEHSVVNGFSATAMAIDYRLSIKIEPSETPNLIKLIIHKSNRNFEFHWDVNRLLEIAKKLPKIDSFKIDSFKMNSLKIDSLKTDSDEKFNSWCTESWIECIKQVESSEGKFEKHYFKQACWIFLSLYYVFKLQGTSLECTVKFDVPISGGLGSSASYCVALSAAMSSFSRALNGEKVSAGCGLVGKERRLVNFCAFECEKITHGTPSGLDNSVIVNGGVLFFKEKTIKSVINSPEEIEKLSENISLLIIDSGVERSTDSFVTSVREFRRKFPKIVNNLFSTIGSINERFFSLVLKSTQNGKCALEQSEINDLVVTNQKMLECLKVSHPKFDEIIAICKRFGVSAKLTGGGGGGAALCIIVKEKMGVMSEMMKELQRNGFRCFIPKITSDGVLVESVEE